MSRLFNQKNRDKKMTDENEEFLMNEDGTEIHVDEDVFTVEDIRSLNKKLAAAERLVEIYENRFHRINDALAALPPQEDV